MPLFWKIGNGDTMIQDEPPENPKIVQPCLTLRFGKSRDRSCDQQKDVRKQATI
jgi:hypothetical protein